MNRLLLALLVAGVVALAALPSVAAINDPPLGDVNGDGVVNIADAVLVLRMSIGLADPTPAAVAAADMAPVPGTGKRVIGDGMLTPADAVQVLDRALNIKLLQQAPKVTMTVFAGSGAAGWADGPRQHSKFQSPVAVAVDANGAIYIADRNNRRIRKIDPMSGDVVTLAGSGQSGQVDSPTGLSAQFVEPKGIAVAPSGDIYVSDGVRIRRIAPDGAVTTLAGSTQGDLDATVGTSAQFTDPRGLAVDSLGNIYVADFGASKVKQITPSGQVTTLIGAFSVLKNPSGVCVDQLGNIYVIDSGNSRLRRFTTDGLVNTLAGSGDAGFADGTGLDAQFRHPLGICIDSAGNLYVADTDNYRIRMVTPTGETVTIAGQSTPGLVEGLGTNAKFQRPTGIAVGPAGDLYITDEFCNRVLRLSAPMP